MSETKKPEEMDSALLGLLAMTAGGPMAMGQMGEWLHTFCQDCDEWLADDRTEDTHARCASILGASGEARTPYCGPLWPGCRGFKHKAGTPGPAKRYRQATQKQWEESKRKAAEVDDA